jgi:hypothetical protein
MKNETGFAGYPEIAERGRYWVEVDGMEVAGGSILSLAVHYFHQYINEGDKVILKGPNGKHIAWNEKTKQ